MHLPHTGLVLTHPACLPCVPCPPALQLMHELAHAFVAGARGIKIAPSFLIPNAQLGTFGSVTQVGQAGRQAAVLVVM